MKRRAHRFLPVLLLATLAGTLQRADLWPPTASQAAPDPLRLPPAVAEAALQGEADGTPLLAVDMITAGEVQTSRLAQTVRSLGGKVTLTERSYLRAQLPPHAISALAASSDVAAIGVNEPVQVEPSPAATLNQELTAGQAAGLLAPSMDAIAARDFRTKTGMQGRGQKVAVIDSGVDPGHPAFQHTPDGEPKLIDWKDFTGEGDVQTPFAVPWESSFSPPGYRETYDLPEQPGASRSARFGFWEETRVPGAINRDLDRNGSQNDRFGVLLVDSQSTGVYDTVYVDTNRNRNFRDETPLHLYTGDRSVGRLGAGGGSESAVDPRFSFVVAGIDPTGKSVGFGFDGLGHGTQVAGVLAGYEPGGYAGVAPGAQIMALKALRSDSAGSWFSIATAIKYAAENGASIINVSIGGLAAASQFDKTSSERLNQIARDYGVLIVLAADNTGPGLSSGVSIGSSSELLTVGAYYSPEMWRRDFGYVVPQEGVLSTSGMGPRSDGSYVPSVVAPGGSPAPSPFWLHGSGYTTAVGTSLATPHVSGAAALLMEAGRREGLHYDRLSIKRALETGTRLLTGLGSYEQGHGLIRLADAFSVLQRLDLLPSLAVASREGNGGFLARSFTPGSTEFTLTNLDRQMGRVSIIASEDWIKTDYRTMALPAATTRRLGLEITPPPDPGIHSGFLTLYHQGKSGPVMTVPITYVRPLVFRPEQDYSIRVSDQLEVARYRRHFIAVEPGTPNLRVALQISQGIGEVSQGSVQVHIFRPDGKVVFRSSEFGPSVQGAFTEFRMDRPVAGTWEVVVTAMPDQTGKHLTATYTLEAQARPGPADSLPIRLNQAAGTQQTHKLTLTNPFSTFTGGVVAAGVVAEQSSVPWRVVRHSTPAEDFTVHDFVDYMRIEVGTPVPTNVDLDLFLLRQDPRDPSGFALVTQSVTNGSSREAIEFKNLPPGRYLVNVLPNGQVPPDLQYQYRRLMAPSGFNLRFSDPPQRHDRGDRWEVSLTIDAPSQPGRYYGYLILRDTARDQTLDWYPFEVSVGQPALAIEPMAPQLQVGRANNVVLELRDAATGGLVDGPILVNQQRFVSRGGRVSVPVQPLGDRLLLQVEADLPGYQFYSKEIRLAAPAARGAHPAGPDPPESDSTWRRKLTLQSP